MQKWQDYLSFHRLWYTYGWDIIVYGAILFFCILVIYSIFRYLFAPESKTNVTYYPLPVTTTVEPFHWPQQQLLPQSHPLITIPVPPSRPTVPQRPPPRPAGPKCSKGEKECKRFLEFYFKKPFVKVRPSFLKNPVTGDNLELDLFNEELQLAVEYHGAQHYHFNEFLHGRSREKFQNQQYRDRIKRELCQQNNVTLIEVPYTVMEEEIAEYLFDELRKLGFDTTTT